MNKEKWDNYLKYFFKNKIYFYLIFAVLLSLINILRLDIDIENKIWVLFFCVNACIIMLIFEFYLSFFDKLKKRLLKK